MRAPPCSHSIAAPDRDRLVGVSRDPNTPSRLERVLALTTLAIIGVAVICFFVTLIVGMNDRFLLAEGVWPVLVALTYIGLPVAFGLRVVLLIISMRRRGKENASDARNRQR